jgi:hypothetical protein
MGKIKEAILYAQMLLALVPQIMTAIAEIEKVSTDNGVTKAGAQKAGIVVGFITAAFDLFPDGSKLDMATERIAAVAQKIVDVVVTFYNATGIFKKSPAREIL